MPRLSQTALATLELVGDDVEVVRRVAVPAELAGEAAIEFQRIVSVQPASWFVPGNTAALVQYCRHVVAARRIDAAIEQAVTDGQTEAVERLLKLQVAESRIIYMLMTSLRLTPQSVAPNRESAKKLTAPESPWRGFGGKRQQAQARPAARPAKEGSSPGD